MSYENNNGNSRPTISSTTAGSARTRKRLKSIPDNRLKTLFADEEESELDLMPDELLKAKLMNELTRPALPAPLPQLPAPVPMLPEPDPISET